MTAWTATLRPNPSDRHPVVFAWDSAAPSPLTASDDSMLAAVHQLAARTPTIAATPTGPFLPPDLSVGYLAFRLVFDLALLAGLYPEEVEVSGDGWQWPASPFPAEVGAVF